MGDESEALQSWHIGDQDEEDYRDHLEEKYLQNNMVMQDRYRANKSALIGSQINCACCGKKITKINYQTQFCRNKGPSNCKDKYWNNTDDKRRLRAQSVAKYFN